MIISNLKIFISEDCDVDYLGEIQQQIQSSARELYKDDKICFTLDTESKEFPFINNDNNMEMSQIKEIWPEDVPIKFKALGDEIYEQPGTTQKTIQHHYTVDELAGLAEDMSKKLAEKEELVEEKKEVTKDFGDRINKVESHLHEVGRKYRQGWEDQTKQCLLQYDFTAGQKLYLHPDSKDLLKAEEMQPEDYQMRFDMAKVTDKTEESIKDETNEESTESVKSNEELENVIEEQNEVTEAVENFENEKKEDGEFL
jgi:hypothetical protein